jgi:DNA primase
MALIPQSFIADLLNRVDIVDVVGQHVKLKKAGANYQGLCPFHSEKSPSFSVSPTKQFYHCFGCGAHGSAISFLMEYSGLGYVDAIEDLARSAGLDVPREERTANDVARQQQAMALSEVMSSAAEWYRQQLKGNTRAVEYLKGRGLTGEIAKRYSLGYAPDGWQGLEAVFGPYTNDDVAKTLVEGGLMIQGEQAEGAPLKRYDRFRDRVMFPIRNPKGQTIGFGGRILDQGEPKYLNSPETPLFSKGNTLYGLFEARQAIRAQEYVLVCEGYMDVVALAQLGFPNAVATLGTACTANHVRMLLRQTDKVVFSFDGDSAGQRAAQRALEACLPLMSDDKEIRFLFLPTEHDPDSYVRAYGAAAFEKVIQEAMSISSFFFKVASEGHDLTTPEGRAHTHHGAKPLLLSMPPIALRTQILRELAIRTNTPPAELEAFCGLTVAPVRQTAYASNQSSQQNNQTNYSQSGNRQGAPWQAFKGSAKRIATQNIEPPKAPTDLAEQMLRVLIQFPHLGKVLDSHQRSLALKAAEQRSANALALMKDLLSQCDQVELIPGENGKSGTVGAGAFAMFQEQLSRSELASMYEVLRKRVMDSDLDLDGASADLEGSFKKLELMHLKQEMTDIAQKIAGSTATDQDKARYRELGEKLKFS